MSWWEFILLSFCVAIMSRFINRIWDRIFNPPAPRLPLDECPFCKWTEFEEIEVVKEENERITKYRCYMCDQKFTIRAWRAK